MNIIAPYDQMVRGALDDYRRYPIPMMRCNLRSALERRRYAKGYERLRGASAAERVEFMQFFEWKWNKHFEKYYAWRVSAGQYREVLSPGRR